LRQISVSTHVVETIVRPFPGNSNFDESMSGTKQQRTRQVAIALVTVATLCAAAYWLRPNATVPLQVLPRVIVAVPQLIFTAPMLVANAQGLFKKEGVDIDSQPYDIGRNALQALLDGKADLALAADTPVMFAALDGVDLAILAGVSSSRRSMAIAARVDSGIHSEEDLAGKSIAITPGTSTPYFLDAMLQNKRIAHDAVKRVPLSNAAMFTAVEQGQVDAAVIFQPNLARLQTDMGDQLKTFYAERLIAIRFVLVGKARYVDQHPQEVRRILRALLAAKAFISADPVAARRIIGTTLKLDDAIMSKIFDQNDFDISLNQAHLLALEDQTRWAVSQGLAKPGSMPNYLKYMRYQHLESISPEAVQLVR
jgi:ABC-type nitrate/sulfonate/bicarbonate transport system substrate-binding protein